MMENRLEAMTREELRIYLLEHREDERAFQIYLDRVTAEPGEIYPAPRSLEDLNHFPELVAKNRRDKEQKN
jgi:hypothetical protein